MRNALIFLGTKVIRVFVNAMDVVDLMCWQLILYNRCWFVKRAIFSMQIIFEQYTYRFRNFFLLFFVPRVTLCETNRYQIYVLDNSR